MEDALKFIEIDGNNSEQIDMVAELENECFNEGSIDHWVIRPFARYGKIYGVEDNRGLAAFAEIIRCWNSEEVFIFSFGVREQSRGVGIGSFLLENIVIALNREGIKKIKLTVAEENSSAKKLYTKFGFKEKEKLINEYGAGNSRILMEYNF